MSERGEIVAWQCQWGGSCPDYHDEFDPIPKEWDGPPDVITPLVRQSDYLALREELDALKGRIAESPRAVLDSNGWSFTLANEMIAHAGKSVRLLLEES